MVPDTLEEFKNVALAMQYMEQVQALVTTNGAKVSGSMYAHGFRHATTETSTIELGYTNKIPKTKPEGAKIEQIGNEKMRVVNKFFKVRALELAHGCIKANNYLAEQMPQALARQTGEKRRMESNMYWAQTSHGPKINSATSLTLTTIQTPLCMSCQHPFLPRMVLSGCGRTHKVKSPDWGFGQQEVTCNQNPTLASSLWYIESNYQPLLEKEKKPLMVNYLKPSFWTKFSEVQSVMWQTNKALVQHHAYGSRPSSWPILKRGMNL
ncbi:hypothetical protein PSTG_02311 [Puccinia striiformis f. sp. tritici PST-78]|uniref:Dolichyl-phosphate-mannose--protein mannosyltransferase n=1 Tax=Puccinia striiformis f. sp. tritici PST-78 TaxID=1165861 RepID=A0A0L0VYK6_9BASI|nr:hypothetical protein PSTG_02311 [Puccinia striiformis f. sp. tritici PST-78]